MAGLNQTPSSERVHIAFFGRRNAGKSSLVNAVTGQDVSVVSSVAGTTTDAVSKAMELLPLRSLSVTAISLVSAAAPCQTDFFNDAARAEKRARLDKAVDKAWGKYGKNAVLPGSLIGSKHLRELKENAFR